MGLPLAAPSSVQGCGWFLCTLVVLGSSLKESWGHPNNGAALPAHLVAVMVALCAADTTAAGLLQ